MGRVEQLLDRDAVDRVDLGRVDDPDRGLARPTSPGSGSPRSCSAGATARAARRTPRHRRRQPGLLLGLAQGRLDARSRRGRSSRRGTRPGRGGTSCRAPARSGAGRRWDPNSRSTAPRRATAPSGGTNRVRSSAVIFSARLHHGLQPVGDHPVTPRYFSAAAVDIGLRGQWRRSASMCTIVAVGIEEDGQRQPGACAATGRVRRARPSGRRPAGRRPRCAGQLERRARLGVEEVDPEHLHPPAGGRRTPRAPASPRGTGRTRTPRSSRSSGRAGRPRRHRDPRRDTQRHAGMPPSHRVEADLRAVGRRRSAS